MDRSLRTGGVRLSDGEKTPALHDAGSPEELAGLGGRPPERPADIAERLGVSVGRIRRLEHRALAKRAHDHQPRGEAQ